MRKTLLLTLYFVFASLQNGAADPVLGLLTDFGLKNEAVGLCHGAILGVDSRIRIVDLSHEVDAYDIREAGLMLRGTTVFPKGSVFVSVIDPGVGTAREPIACRTSKGFFYIAPNNGLLTFVAHDQRIDEVVRIDPKRVNPKWEPGTFDGRDLFSPAGAMLASSAGDLKSIGTPISPEKLVLLPIQLPQVDKKQGVIKGTYVRTDEPYGNVWTDISRDDLTSIGVKLSDTIRVKAGSADLQMPLTVSFGHVPEGKPLAYFNSAGALAFAINMGDFRAQYKLEKGMPVTVQRAAPPK